MSDETVAPGFLASIQPVVLVGGKSSRFGRDKLREPWGDNGQALVQRPIESFRAVFGRRVLLVGECHSSIRPFADGIIQDSLPGIGPIGGIVSALQSSGGPVFVLAGDMPSFQATDIWNVLRVAQGHPAAMACWARTEQLHPCAGLYLPRSLPVLRARVLEGRMSLMSALPTSAVVSVDVRPLAATNINFPTTQR